MMQLIDYQSATIVREYQTLFKDIDLQIADGEFVYLIGKVGTGKSSLLQTLYGELPISKESHKANVLDFDLCKLKRSKIPYLRRQIGIIFQDFQLLTDRSVEENLRFVLKATGWNKKSEINERIEKVLTEVDMQNKGFRMPNTLSGGEQQRIVIARALLNEPKIILADEPTGNLDPETGDNIVRLLYRICAESKTSVIMSTHNLHLPQKYPGRVLCVEGQKLVDVTEMYSPNYNCTDFNTPITQFTDKQRTENIESAPLNDTDLEEPPLVILSEVTDEKDQPSNNVVEESNRIEDPNRIEEISKIEEAEELETAEKSEQELSTYQNENVEFPVTEVFKEETAEVDEEPIAENASEEEQVRTQLSELSAKIEELKVKLASVKESQTEESHAETRTSFSVEKNEDNSAESHLKSQDNPPATGCCNEQSEEKPLV